MESIIIQETAKKIQDARKEKGISGDEAAKLSGMHRATYYRYEGGDLKNMKLDKLQRIAEALGVYAADLIVWGEEKPIPSEGDGQDEKDKMLIRWFRSLPEEKQKAILISQDAPEGLV